MKKTFPNKCLKISDDLVLWRTDDGTGRLLHFDGRFLALSRTACEILELLLQHDRRQVTSLLSQRYRISTSKVEEDVQHLEKSLARRGIRISMSQGWRPFFKNAYRTPIAAGFFVFLLGIRTLSRWPGLQATLLLTLAFWATRLVGWPRTVMTWRATSSSNSKLNHNVSSPSVIDATSSYVQPAVAAHFLPVACKERALTSWWLLRVQGVFAKVVVAVDDYPFGCHCWCESDESVVADYPDRCLRYSPVAFYS